jgi:hypothetical protein
MRVLLREGADRAIAETILVLPCTFMETVWGPLLEGEAHERIDEAYVADVTVPVIARAVRAAIAGRRRPGPSAHELYRYVRFTTRLIEPYVIGSRIRMHVDTYYGCELDCSQAVLTTEAARTRGAFTVGR